MNKNQSDKSLIVIAGPTAAGKTDLAVQLAHHFDTEILSADSRQFYREMNIGTAKPTTEEMQVIRHHFINSLSIHDEYNVGRYESDALKCLEKLFVKKNTAVLCGGSGLFIKAVCEGLDEMPAVDPEIRQQLNRQYENEGPEQLLAELKQTDPDYFSTVDQNNPRRIIRALEVIKTTGKPFSSFRSGEKPSRSFKLIKIGLHLPRTELYQKIDTRVDQMIEIGLFEEAKKLYPFRHLNTLQTVGYSEIFDCLDGKFDHTECIRLIKRNTRRYAKRQLTWFKNNFHAEWFEKNQYQSVLQHLKKK